MRDHSPLTSGAALPPDLPPPPAPVLSPESTVFWMWSNRLTDQAEPDGEWSSVLLNDKAFAPCLLTYAFFELRAAGVLSLAVETKTRLRMHFTHAIARPLPDGTVPHGQLESRLAKVVAAAKGGESVERLSRQLLTPSTAPWSNVRQLASNDAVAAGAYVVTTTGGTGILGSLRATSKLEPIADRVQETRTAADQIYGRWHAYRTAEAALFAQVKKEAQEGLRQAVYDPTD